MIAYKLIRLRKNGQLSPLFINKKFIYPIGEWLVAEAHFTKGFKFRKGFHVTHSPRAPHLTNKGRVWYKVEIEDYEEVHRPENQGGLWYLAQRMRILEKV
jgi:hypothetical protein